jgi:hypothetical protein
VIIKVIEKAGFEKLSIFIWLASVVVLAVACFILRRITDLCEKIYKKAVSKKQIN